MGKIVLAVPELMESSQGQRMSESSLPFSLLRVGTTLYILGDKLGHEALSIAQRIHPRRAIID